MGFKMDKTTKRLMKAYGISRWSFLLRGKDDDFAE